MLRLTVVLADSPSATDRSPHRPWIRQELAFRASGQERHRIPPGIVAAMMRLVIALVFVTCSRGDVSPPSSVPIADARAAVAVDAVAADAAIDAAIAAPADAKRPVDTSRGAVLRVNGGEPGVFPFGVAVPSGKTIYVWLYAEPWPCNRPVSDGPQRYVAFGIPLDAKRSFTTSIGVKGMFTMPIPEAIAKGAAVPEHTILVMSHIPDGRLTIDRRGRKRGERVRGRLAGEARDKYGTKTEATGNFDVELCRDVGSS